MFGYSDQISVLSAQLVLVEQHRYDAGGGSAYTAMPSHKFESKDGTPAVKLCEILQSGSDSVLAGANDLILFSLQGEHCREKISHRLRIIGFDGVYKVDRQVSASSIDRRNRNGRVPLMRRRVAQHIAQSVRNFMKKTPGECWKLLGEDRQHAVQITFDHLYLLEMINVSEGSWQPLLAYEKHPEVPPPPPLLPENINAYGMGTNGYANIAGAAGPFVDTPGAAQFVYGPTTAPSVRSGLAGAAQSSYGSTAQQSAYDSITDDPMHWFAYYTSASQSANDADPAQSSYGSIAQRPAYESTVDSDDPMHWFAYYTSASQSAFGENKSADDADVVQPAFSVSDAAPSASEPAEMLSSDLAHQNGGVGTIINKTYASIPYDPDPGSFYPEFESAFLSMLLDDMAL